MKSSLRKLVSIGIASLIGAGCGLSFVFFGFMGEAAGSFASIGFIVVAAALLVYKSELGVFPTAFFISLVPIYFALHFSIYDLLYYNGVGET